MRIDEYQRIYEAKHDDELLLLAESSPELTDEARAALQSELSRRGLRSEITSPTPPPIELLGKSRSPHSQFTSVGVFLTEVMSTYRAHFWLFVGLVAPAIVVGFFGRELSRMFGRHLVQELLAHAEGLSSSKARFEAAAVGGIINTLIWICFCICYAGTASAVVRIREGDSALIRSSLNGVFDRPGRFFAISTVLGLSFVALESCCFFVYFWLLTTFKTQLRGTTGWVVLYAFYFIAVLVLSRFALAIPAVTLGDCAVREAMFRSDEMTEGKWNVLAALLIKSIVGGYVAGMLPFWIARWAYVRVNGWILSALSVAGVSLVEPILFIGFSLLYLDASQPAVQDKSRSVSVQLA